MSRLKLGIVGCGIAARRFHRPALAELNDKFEIAGVTNRSREKAVSFAESIGGTKIFESYEKMLESDSLDAVDLAVPIKLNPEFIEKALDHGLNVICEKPIAPGVEEGKRVVELNRKSDKVVYIAENFRHLDRAGKAKKLIDQGEIAQPRFVSRQVWPGMSRKNEFARTSWRKNPDHAGGFLSDGGVHHIAELRLILGDIGSVFGFTGKISDLPGKYDSLEMGLNFENGVFGSYTVSYGMEAEDSFKIHGDEGTLRVSSDSISLSCGTGTKEIQVNDNDGFKEEFEDFYEVIKGDKENDLGKPMEGLKDLAAIEAGIASAKAGRREELSSFIGL